MANGNDKMIYLDSLQLFKKGLEKYKADAVSIVRDLEREINACTDAMHNDDISRRYLLKLCEIVKLLSETITSAEEGDIYMKKLIKKYNDFNERS